MLWPKIAGDFSDCCADKVFDVTEATCCNGVLFQAYGTNNVNGDCCSGQLYDRSCYLCNAGQVVPIAGFTPGEDMCCDGNVLPFVSNFSCCCGDQVIDAETHECCDGLVQPKATGSPRDCCDCGTTKLDLAFVLDSSDSVDRDTDWPKLLNFVDSFVQSMPKIDTGDVRVGVVTYRKEAKVEFYLDEFTTRATLQTAIMGILTITRSEYVKTSTSTDF
ncbi:MATN3-like protein [Mya arenaria]|uniref:MATN3-like protein n=1 Tax=Mya arenaria TaxID=6604 RepID=A0ABY7FWV4_MYAAR|nr:MATN3-like protein [Mya arenaria]